MSASGSPLLARVALPLAIAHPLLYAVPENLADTIRPGHRVRVPLRKRTASGIVVAIERETQAADERGPRARDLRLREIVSIDPETPLLSPALLELVAWIGKYYAAPIGIVMESAIPRAVLRPPRKTKHSPSEEVGTDEGGGEALPSLEEPREEAIAQAAEIALNEAQATALAAIVDALQQANGRTFLMQGVTGSGKTEVYLRAIASAIERGQSALLLVPEIALGTQVVSRVRERFGSLAVEYHSQLTPVERRDAWWKVFRGEARIAVGARSAVFLPLVGLGLIVIDEEHEPSYKQGETPRYHGRDTALVRAKLEKAVTVLGSATPSLESRWNAEQGKYARLLLPDRVEARSTAQVTLVDLRAKEEAGASTARTAEGLRIVGGAGEERGEPLSTYLLDRLRAVLAERDQAILFLNRRGFSTAVQCRACGRVFECPRCSVVLTFHRAEGSLRCHYCGHEARNVEHCAGCGGHDFAYSGVGTQRVEAALARHLPEARVLRMDFDSTRRRGSLARMIRAFEKKEADILLGTQMVAKGFDFPDVTLVGVIQADREMGFPDFRAQERAFQLLTQVAGRAGRGNKPGEVVFQTYLPDHHVITTAGLQDYEAFFHLEMEERRALRYAPFGRMANLLFDGPDEAAVVRKASAIAQSLEGIAGLTLLGPAPMPLSRLKGQYRWHLTLLATQAARLSNALRQVLAAEERPASGRGRVRVQADMDPVSML
ncbi:MAG: primosomal protein N' [Candidatus Eisenbacteria bacterium]|nr:primosomal protein N' [Candidatus Eisenbacteria bacterium]